MSEESPEDASGADDAPEVDPTPVAEESTEDAETDTDTHTDTPVSATATPAAMPSTDAAEKPPKLSKADKLAARADALRVREAQRASEREARASAGGGPAATTSPRGWVIATATLSVVTVVLATLLVIAYFAWHDDNGSGTSTAAAPSAPASSSAGAVSPTPATATSAAEYARLDAARAAALKAAKAYAVAFGSYNYQHLNTDFAKTSEYLTPAFAKRYKKTSSALSKTFVAYKTKVTASVPSAAVISASTSKAQVLVLLDQVITSSQSTTPKINRNRLKVSLVDSSGKWLVSSTDAT